MAPKVKCLRCPAAVVDDFKHHRDLAKCQKHHQVNGKPYNLEDLWPAFDGMESAEHNGAEEANQFIDQVTESVHNGAPQPWSKETMEAAATLACSVPKANASKPKLGIGSTKPSSILTHKGKAGDSAKGNTTTAPSAPNPIAPEVNGPWSDTIRSHTKQAPSLASAPENRLTAAASPAATANSSSDGASSALVTLTSHHATPQGPAAPVAPAVPPVSAIPAATTALGPLTNPAGPSFMTQARQQTDQATALTDVQALAGRLADTEHTNSQQLNDVPQSSRTQLSDQQRDQMKLAMTRKFGLRPGFTATDNNTFVETNFLSMTYPNRIFVYDVKMIRDFDIQKNPILVKKQWDKLKVLQEITFGHPQYPQYSNALRTNLQSWVSDGSMMWSTVGLFNAASPGQTPPPLVSTPGQIIGYENEMGHQLTVDRIEITFRQDFDMTGRVGQLFFDPTAVSFRESGPEILTRGLNAFYTRFVRDRSDPEVPTLPSSFVRVGSNRSFRMAAGRELDGNIPANQTIHAMPGFSLSVRPGVGALYINASNSTSPFIKPMTVQDFMHKCVRLQHRSFDEAASALKAIKVRIVYDTVNNNISFPRANSRFRFVTGVATGPNAPTKPLTYPRVVDAAE